MSEHDPYAGTSGLIDDVDGTIVSAAFVYDADYNDGNTLIARIEFAVDDMDEEEPEVFKLSTGSGWEDAEKGKSAVRENGGDPKGFNKSTGYQSFLLGALESGADEVIRGRGMPWEADIWPGLRFHVQRVPYTTPGGEEKDRLIPTDYLGLAEDAEKPAKKTGGAKKAAPKKAAAKEAADDDDGDDEAGPVLPAKLRVKLKKLAAECDTHDEFVERAFSEIDEVEGDDDAEAAVMEDGDGGVYEIARNG